MQTSERAGLLYTLAGFCTLSIGDAIVKGMAGEWPAPAMVLTRYVTGTVLLAIVLKRQGGWRALTPPIGPLQWLRGIAISISAISMFMAVWVLPLAEATTIFFSQPMITALLAMVFLREPARASTWIASLIAFVGVAIVLRPNFEAAGLAVLLPLLSAAGMSVTIIANRAARTHAGVLVMQYYMSVTAMLFMAVTVPLLHLSGLEPFRLDWPHWSVVARCMFIGLSATGGQMLIYMGTVRAGAATVAPMTYGQLLMAVVLGALFFGEIPDALALLGAAIVIGAGLYLWYANRLRKPPVVVP